MKRITITLSVDEDIKKLAEQDSKQVLGVKNISGYFSYLIKKNNREL